MGSRCLPHSATSVDVRAEPICVPINVMIPHDGGAFPTSLLQRRRRTFPFSSLFRAFHMLLFKLSLCLLSLVARSMLTSALNITVLGSQIKAPGPINLELDPDPANPEAGAVFFLSSSVNASFPPTLLGSAGVNTQILPAFEPHMNFTFNLPSLPESGGWVITARQDPAPNPPQEGPIIGTSNTFSVIPGPQPKSTESATASVRKSFPVGAIVGLCIGGVVIVAAIAGLIIVLRRRGSTRPSSVEDGRLRGPAPWASTASSDSLPQKAPWIESERTV
ncbi:hypothetical protein B0H19DRAFT_1175929 [Mycena capillaripes]|nr:hypothetical protein B0H19DRAFT_1175929 [Mycena capillaripes]